MRHARTASRFGWILAVIIPLAACSQGPSPEVQARIDSLQAARDSLTRALAEQNEYVQGLSQRIEDAMGDMGEAGSVTPENLGDRISALRDELETARSQLAESQQRIRALNRRALTLRDSLDSVTATKNEALAAQRDSIQGLMASLDSMQAGIRNLSTARSDLSDALTTVEQKYYTVYYVVGTKDELKAKGLVEEQGGARVLLVLWKAGETLVPARNLDPSQMQAIDLRQVHTIELPGPGTYRLVSRQNTEYLEPMPDEDGRFSGDSLRITAPEQFWASSPYLIIVRED